MKEEMKQILKMIEEGKITAEQGIQLMEAGGFDDEGSISEHRAVGKSRWLRIRIYDVQTNRRKVNIGVPLALISVGLKLGMKFGLDREELEGFNFEEIIQMIESGEEGTLVDVVDEKQGDRVEIFVE